MIEHKPGIFSEVMDADSVVDELAKMLEGGAVPHAVHFGSHEYLNSLKNGEDVESRLKSLEEKISKLEAEQRIENNPYIVFPDAVTIQGIIDEHKEGVWTKRWQSTLENLAHGLKNSD